MLTHSLANICRPLQPATIFRRACAGHPRHHQQEMSAEAHDKFAAAVTHPASSHADQLQWEQALMQQQQQQPSSPTTPAPAAATSHPAVGATQGECAEWEAALCGQSSGVYAVVECGSHSTRLLLSTGSSDIARLTRDTHLGGLSAAEQQTTQQQTSPTTTAVPAAAAATLAAVHEYKLQLDSYQQQQQLLGLRAVATAAVREAEGQAAAAVAAAISKVLKCRLEVLTGEQEAVLAFKGATACLCSGSSSASLCVVVDLGGRSTEVAVGVAGSRPLHTASIPLGCLLILQGVEEIQHTGACAPAPASSGQELMQAAQSILDAHTEQLAHIRSAVVDSHRPVTVVATGGSVTTLAALKLQLQEYSHEAVHTSLLHRSDLQQLLLADARAQRPSWLTPARAQTLPAGCAGLLALLDWLGVQEEVLVSDCDLLDGVVAEMVVGSVG